MFGKNTYDLYLIIVTTVLLFIISVICVYSMFYFKISCVNEMVPSLKMEYLESMNLTVSPFVVFLIIILGICVPKRLVPVEWINRFAIALIAIVIAVWTLWGITNALLLVLFASFVLQCVVLLLAAMGSQTLKIEKKGYWVRLGSSLAHLGLILFLLDIFLYKYRIYHLTLFWLTTIISVTGMIFCFYAESIISILFKNRKI